VSKSERPDKQSRSESALCEGDMFELPRTIAAQLRKCVEAASEQVVPRRQAAKYLWIDLAGEGGSRTPHEPMGARKPALEEWLNIVDEAASVGVHWLVICGGTHLSAHPETWSICRWAQNAHGMDVGIHTHAQVLSASEMDHLARLGPGHTWLFVRSEHIAGMREAEARGVKVCASDVEECDQAPPCDLPLDMVYAGPQGVLYSCGLVLDDDRFCFGHISERPLDQVLNDTVTSRHVPAWVPYRKHACDACPPIMAKRMSPEE
jgi:hypothetical protein